MGDIEKRLDDAKGFLESGDSNRGRDILLEVLQEDPDHQAALVMLGGEYFNNAQLSEAEMIFERLILNSPGKGEFSIALFNTLWKAGRSEEALEEIKRFMANADQDAERETIMQYAALTQKLSDVDG